MVTVHREAGLRFIIFVDDHPPAHVHVIGDGTMKIEIAGPDGLPLAIATSGMKRGDRRKAMDVVRDHQEYLLACWREIHGGD